MDGEGIISIIIKKVYFECHYGIIGVADAYDAMSNARCYRQALDKDVIVSELTKGAGSQFDPEIVPIMLKMMEEGSVPVDLEGNPVTR